MQIKCVIFDMDGLMVDSERLTYMIMRDYYRTADTDFTLDYYKTLIGISIDETCDKLIEDYPHQPLNIDGFRDIYVQCVADGQLCVKPGLYELLDHLDTLHIPKAVASSNTSDAIDYSLQHIGVLKRFSVIICDGMVARCKPAPDLFLKAAQLLGFAPKNCLVLEDSEAGVRAAHAAGCPVIMIPDLIQPSGEIAAMCCAVCDSLSDVIPIIIKNR